ncbi:MAG: class I SAM-dependent methyltransferase [Dehalococcoidia bacterium]|nr:class I SAM-dependent methyltransferase [Dehalococcoidia bacterium]
MKIDQFKLHADIEERHWWFLGRRQIMRELVSRLFPTSKTLTVVDIGCGTGGNIAALAESYTRVGIDTSEEAIRFARSRFQQVRFIHVLAPADVTDVVQQADIVLLMDVLEHIPDDFAFLSALLDAAAPGAHLLLTVPADMSLWSEHDVSFGHYRRYDMRGFGRLWEGLPVTTRLLSYYNTRLYPVVKLMRALSRWRGRAWGAAGTDFSIPMQPLNSILAKVLASESKVLVDVLEGRRAQGFGEGVSLIALLRRGSGAVTIRTQPQGSHPRSAP